MPWGPLVSLTFLFHRRLRAAWTPMYGPAAPPTPLPLAIPCADELQRELLPFLPLTLSPTAANRSRHCRLPSSSSPRRRQGFPNRAASSRAPPWSLGASAELFDAFPSRELKHLAVFFKSGHGVARRFVADYAASAQDAGFQLFPTVCLKNESTSATNSYFRASSSSTHSTPLFYQPR